MSKNMFGFLILFTFILKVQSFYEGQMIDAHGHIAGEFDDELIIQLMDENSISKQVVMARYMAILMVMIHREMILTLLEFLRNIQIDSCP